MGQQFDVVVFFQGVDEDIWGNLFQVVIGLVCQGFDFGVVVVGQVYDGLVVYFQGFVF